MKKITSAFFVLLMLLSCSTIPTGKDETIDQAFEQTITKAPSPSSHTPPTDITDALIPDFNQTLFKTRLKPKPTTFNISLHEVDAREFFMGLVIDSDENMLVHPDVSGLISMELKNVSIAQVMNAVQKVYGYDYKKNDIGYFVYPATLQTKIFRINHLDLVRVGESVTRVSSGQFNDNSNGSNSANNSSRKSNSNSQSVGSWIKTKAKTDFWQEIETALLSILSIDSQATVSINHQTGVIVVRAKPMQLREVENFINITQKQISKQVIIEAKIIEIILNDSHQAGVNWQSIAREAINTAPILTGIGALGTTFKDVFTIGAKSGDFAAYVELLETQGKTNILSSPRISTLNNQKAIIKVGSDEYFITDISTNTSTGNSDTNQEQDITWTPFFSGISLDVTPQINSDVITLHIHPSITRVENQVKEFTIDGEDGSLPLALNTVRESDSIVQAQNGQIIVIGGLMQEITEENKTGIAGLTQIPYIGNLFRVNTGETTKSELVILLKATIINSQDDWAPHMDPSKQHLKQLQNHPLWK